MLSTTTEKNSPSVRNGKQQNSTLGPVPNLEDHVNPDWWRRLFNSLYLKTDADVVEDERITREEVNMFTELLNLFSPLICIDPNYTIRWQSLNTVEISDCHL